MGEYDLTLWEILRNCYRGAYIGGEKFESENGKILYFDGTSLNCKELTDIKEKFKYLGDF